MENLDFWKKLDVIKHTFAPTLTDSEFKLFVGLGASLGANPFNREIWAVKYGNQSAQIFLGRDFYRRKAQEQGDYAGHIVDAVYSNDEFTMVNGVPNHKYSLNDRGRLLGAYCVVYKKGTSPYFVFVNYDEYNTNQSNWKTKPATMIKKVAEAQALRGAFQGVFAGTYDESEAYEIKQVNDLPKITSEEERLIALIHKCNTVDELEALRQHLTNFEGAQNAWQEKYNTITSEVLK